MLSHRAMLRPTMRLRHAVCPTCGADVTVTYWPYSVPLYTVHLVRGSQRECGSSLRPVEGHSENDARRTK
jgi:hypothetical protein